jgi:hypothetical protein
MIRFGKSHILIGILFLVIFLLSGVYMLINFPELYAGREEIRMMFRATHIYILLASLVNLMAGNYLLSKFECRFLQLRRLASSLIIVAPFLFFIAFVIEPPSYLIERPISFWGVVALVAGVILHSILNLKWLHKNAI